MPEIRYKPFADFSRKEFVCKCGCGAADMTLPFMDKLQALRDDFGGPMKISSGFRCPDYNDSIAQSGRTGSHTMGMAADVRVSGTKAYELLVLALAHGFKGVGVCQKGLHNTRFIHLDLSKGSKKMLRPTVWSY